MTTFKSQESYAHKYAKEILIEWLEEKRREKNLTECSFYTEYPITTRQIDERHTQLLAHENWNFITEDYQILPENYTVQECFDRNWKVLKVVDVALISKGVVIECFEIVHKNKISEETEQMIQDNFKGTYVYEISTSSILNRMEPPENLYEYCTRIN